MLSIVNIVIIDQEPLDIFSCFFKYEDMMWEKQQVYKKAAIFCC